MVADLGEAIQRVVFYEKVQNRRRLSLGPGGWKDSRLFVEIRVQEISWGFSVPCVNRNIAGQPELKRDHQVELPALGPSSVTHLTLEDGEIAEVVRISVVAHHVGEPDNILKMMQKSREGSRLYMYLHCAYKARASKTDTEDE